MQSLLNFVLKYSNDNGCSKELSVHSLKYTSYCFKIQCSFNVTNQSLLMNTNQHHFTVVVGVVLSVCSQLSDKSPLMNISVLFFIRILHKLKYPTVSFRNIWNSNMTQFSNSINISTEDKEQNNFNQNSKSVKILC